MLTPPGDGVTISSGNPVPEPASGSVPATFTITLPAAQSSDTTVTYQTIDGTATAATSYIVTASPGGTSTTVNGSSTTATLSGLHNGTLYTFTVTAINSIGAGPPATATATPAGSTSPPSASISSPADGAGFALGQTVNASYSCTAGAGETLRSCAGPSANGAPIDTLTTGRHTFTVTATDTDGQSASVTHVYMVTPVETTPTSLTRPLSSYCSRRRPGLVSVASARR